MTPKLLHERTVNAFVQLDTQPSSRDNDAKCAFVSRPSIQREAPSNAQPKETQKEGLWLNIKYEAQRRKRGRAIDKNVI